MAGREKVDGYAGVYYRMADRIGGKGQEKVYYVVYKKDGKVVEAKAGRQYADDMTPARASKFRNNLIEGRDQTRQEKRIAEKAAKEAENTQWTINALWDHYCASHADNKSLTNEKAKYELYVRSGLGKKEPHELVPLDVDRLRLKLQRAGKRTMAARVLELLRRSVNYGIKRGLVPPIKFKIEIPRLNNEVTEDLSPEQIKKLVKALDNDEDQTAANVMRLALFTGMRKGEIFKLRWDDIDFRRGFITMLDPKGGKDSMIPLNAAARAVFESIEQGDSEYVFPGRFPGTHLTACKKSFARIAKAAEFPLGFRPIHGLRHVYASMLASSGEVEMHVLQRLMTHKNIQTTMRYAHLRDQTLKDASGLAGTLIDEAVAEKDEKDENRVVNLEGHSQ
ncbi:MAG: site-specific integrase [Desulfobacteraceae bacterium]|nr:site-specific integrase [Desulfobacteraceae bacterium]MBC2751913.1 site-specific integrase [Desulfobacteraceae bacterium]